MASCLLLDPAAPPTEGLEAFGVAVEPVAAPGVVIEEDPADCASAAQSELGPRRLPEPSSLALSLQAATNILMTMLGRRKVRMVRSPTHEAFQCSARVEIHGLGAAAISSSSLNWHDMSVRGAERRGTSWPNYLGARKPRATRTDKLHVPLLGLKAMAQGWGVARSYARSVNNAGDA
jgi:hypothetical protein